MPSHAITVFFDGACPVCSREVRLYRHLTGPDAIQWRDIDADAGTLQDEGIRLSDALALLHVRDGAGTLHIGLDAHLCLWDRLPLLRHLAAVLRHSPRLCALADRVYRQFTRWRPGLRQRTRPANGRG